MSPTITAVSTISPYMASTPKIILSIPTSTPTIIRNLLLVHSFIHPDNIMGNIKTRLQAPVTYLMSKHDWIDDHTEELAHTCSKQSTVNGMNNMLMKNKNKKCSITSNFYQKNVAQMLNQNYCSNG